MVTWTKQRFMNTYMHMYRHKLCFLLFSLRRPVLALYTYNIYIYTYTHPYRNFAEAKVEVAKSERAVAVVKKAEKTELDRLQMSIDKAEKDLSGIKLIEAVTRNATAIEIEARKQFLISISAAYPNSLPVSGDKC